MESAQTHTNKLEEDVEQSVTHTPTKKDSVPVGRLKKEPAVIVKWLRETFAVVVKLLRMANKLITACSLTLLTVALLLNLAGYLVRSIMGVIIINKAIDIRSKVYGPVIIGDLDTLIPSVLGPGNAASIDFRVANIVNSFLGIATSVVGLSHLIRRRYASKLAASTANLLTIAVNFVVGGLAVKQLSLPGKLPRELEALGWIAIFQLPIVIIYELLILISPCKKSRSHHEGAPSVLHYKETGAVSADPQYKVRASQNSV